MSCVNLDRDQTFTVHDFGPRGYVGNVNVNLTDGMQPGAMLSVVVLADQEVYINMYDADKNILIHFGGRIARNMLIFNTRLGETWGAEEKVAKNPLVKGVRTSITLIYETDGYRVFVNGEQQIFYKHRANTRPSQVEITNGQVFKVIYHTTMDIIP